jgi:hypothetical protein
MWRNRPGDGSGRRFPTNTQKSLVTDLCSILAPQYATRAREIATRMTKLAGSLTAAGLLEGTARLNRVGYSPTRLSG